MLRIATILGSNILKASGVRLERFAPKPQSVGDEDAAG
jgi:hypothetical protein